MGTGCCLPKTTFRTIFGGAGLGEHAKIWDPLHISATIEANNFKCGTQIGFGTSLAKTTFKTKIGGGLGNIQKKLGPLLISATVEASNFKFGIQLEFGASLPKKTTFRTKIGGGLGQGSIQKKLGPPIYFCNRLKNWYTTGLPCQTQVLGPN